MAVLICELDGRCRPRDQGRLTLVPGLLECPATLGASPLPRCSLSLALGSREKSRFSPLSGVGRVYGPG